VFLSEVQLVAGTLVQALEKVRLGLDHGGEILAGEAASLHRPECFRRDRITLLQREAEEVPWEREAHDLAPAIGQQAGEAQCALDDVKHRLGRLALAEQSLPLIEGVVMAEGLQLLKLGKRQHRADADQADLAIRAAILRAPVVAGVRNPLARARIDQHAVFPGMSLRDVARPGEDGP
jgi:hypothetical protein